MSDKLYTVDWSVISGYTEFGGYKIPLPKMPPKSQMVNYNLPKSQQKFRHTEIPKSIQRRKNRVTKEEEQFIADEWHKRKNGIWILINGQPIYFTGPYYFFLNYWWTIKGIHPGFRYFQCCVFQLWMMVVRNVNCYGLFLIGPRRGGKTEFTLGEEYEYCTRVRNVQGHNQSKNDTEAYKNFKRITKANKKMIWFMKPVHKGSDDPEEMLEFYYPSERMTDAKMRTMALGDFDESELQYSEEELASKIDFEPAKASAYDGQETNRGILNEAGKLETMSLIKWWEVFKPTLHYFDGAQIVGKCWVESSIEEISDEQIDEVNEFWKDSDPEKLNENGRTTTGLWRVFITVEDVAEPDEFGFPKREEAKARLEKEIANLRKLGKEKAIGSLLRKSPQKVEDALTPSGEKGSFNKERLSEILQRLDYPSAFGLADKEWTVKGNFEWVNGARDTKVVFRPCADGKWDVSQLLKDGMDNKFVFIKGIRYPANVRHYRGSCDPFEHDLEEIVDKNRASKGAGAIFRMYNDMVDGAKKHDDGTPFNYGWDWETNQFVADYLAREEDPNVFFEDMLMMHVYYGTQMNVENNKRSIKGYFKARGYEEYLMDRPEVTFDTKAYEAKGVKQVGTPATTDTIDQYFMAIAHYIMNYGNAIKHRRIVLAWLTLNKSKKSRTVNDTGVCAGWGLLAKEKVYLRFPDEEVEESKEAIWFEYHTV
jgi:hypothetical protein